MRAHPDPQSILIVKLSALGDVIMSLPTLRALKTRYPDAVIDWLVEAPAAGILRDDPDLGRVIVSPRHEFLKLIKSGHWIQGMKLLLAFRRELRTREYDVVLDLQGLFKSGVNLWLSRGRRKVGFDKGREKSHWFLNERMPPYDLDRHAGLRYLDAAVYLGADRPALPLTGPYYTPTEAGLKESVELLAAATAGEGYVVLNPGARRASKCWPLAQWRELIRRLVAETEFGVVITGGKDEASEGEDLAGISPKVLNLCGRSTLAGLGGILAGAKLMVTGDTGPMHLAAALGCRGLAFFGPTRPERTGPFGGHFQILTPDRCCVGCLKRECPKSCLEELSEDTVWERLKFLLLGK